MLNFDFDLKGADIAEMDPGASPAIITAQFVQHVAARLHRTFNEATPATRRIYAGDVMAAIAEALRELDLTEVRVTLQRDGRQALRVEAEG